jgi:hypothetical protein
MSLIFLTEDIFNILAQWMTAKDFVVLMISCKTLRNKIGTSKLWKRFCSVVPLKKSYQYLKYTKLCTILDENKLYPTNIKIRDYYAEEYYSWRFCEITPFIHFRLRNICFANFVELVQFKDVIEEICQIGYIQEFFNTINMTLEYFDILESYNVMIENYDKLFELRFAINHDVLSNIIIPSHGFRTGRIIIDAKNEIGAIKQMIKNANCKMVMGNYLNTIYYDYINDTLIEYHGECDPVSYVDIIISNEDDVMDGYIFKITDKKSTYEIIPSEWLGNENNILFPYITIENCLSITTSGSSPWPNYPYDYGENDCHEYNPSANKAYFQKLGARLQIEETLLHSNVCEILELMTYIRRKNQLEVEYKPKPYHIHHNHANDMVEANPNRNEDIINFIRKTY